jgi:GT2 family glycosyltransferase
VICSRNRPQLLADCVRDLLAGETLPAELVIVDQSRAPHLWLKDLGEVQGCRITYRWSHSVGLCRARNEGIAAARHDLLAFTDDDMVVPPTWLKALLETQHAAGPDTVVTGQVLPAPTETPGGFVPALQVGDHTVTYRGRPGTDVLAAGNMAMYRSLYQRVGPFDERLGAGAHFPAADDNDFGYRLLECGFAITYAPDAALYHRPWRAQQDYLRVRWAYGRGQGGFYAKHLSSHDSYMLRRLLGYLARRVYLLPGRLRHERRRALGDVVNAFAVLVGVVGWSLAKRAPR